MTHSAETIATDDASTRPWAAPAAATTTEDDRRFGFGRNWQRYSRLVDEARIREAETSLRTMLGRASLAGLRFLDIGSGSGLFSLAAARLGATVHSFDYDRDSVACTTAMRQTFGAEHAARWTIEQGSVLDAAYMERLGKFDIVYSWGVLHHTGEMWRACTLAAERVAEGGTLFIAIYNDQGAWSGRWTRIKRFYCSSKLAAGLVSSVYIGGVVLRNLAADLVWMRNPARRYTGYSKARGMSFLYDAFDWLGGYPFEVAKPEEIFEFFERRGFEMRRLTTCGGSVGCNEFVFQRVTADASKHK